MAYHLKNRHKDSIVKTGFAKSVANLMYIAQQKGFFSDYNVKMHSKPVPYARKSMELMIEGVFNAAYLLEVNLAYLGYFKSKIPIKCIASLETRQSDSIILRHEKGEKPTPNDLRGKTIGFTPRTTSHSFLMKFIDEYNIPKHSITLKPVSPQAMPNALIRREVDAISIWHAYTQHALVAMHELGLHWTHFKNNGLYESEVVLAVTKPFLVKHRKTCINMLAAMSEAEKYISENPEELYSIMCSQIGLSPDVLNNLSPVELDDIVKTIKLKVRPVGNNFIKNIELVGQWIKENDTEFIGQKLPDYTDFIDNSLFIDFKRQSNLQLRK